MPGACRLGDRSKALLDTHGCVGCVHPNVMGPAISASANVCINGAPALRKSDNGIHVACCGTNTWRIIGASASVCVNGEPLVRKGDPTKHCGGPGQMIDASSNVSDGSPFEIEGPGLELKPFEFSFDSKEGPKIGPSLSFKTVSATAKTSIYSPNCSSILSPNNLGCTTEYSASAAGPEAEAFAGLKNGQVGFDVGGDFGSVSVGAGPLGASVSAGGHLGLKVGEKTQVKLGPVSFSVDFSKIF